MAHEIRTSNGMMRSVLTANSMPMEDEEYAMPSFEVDTKAIPEAEDWEVGKEYKVELLVKQKRISSEGKGKMVKFCVLKIKAL